MAAWSSPFKVQSRRFASAVIRRLPVRKRRRRPVRILFDAFNAMNVVCLRPMIDALMAHPDVRVFLMNSRERCLDTARALFTAAGYAREQVVLATSRTRWGTWDLYVCTDQPSVRRSWLWKGAPRVYADHGISGARNLDGYWWELRRDLLPTYAAIFVTGELFLPEARQSCQLGGCPGAPQLIGFPKLDRLVDGSLQRDRIAHALRLDPTRPTVMFAPSWGPYSLGTLAFDEVIGLLLRDDRYNVLIKLHQLQRENAETSWQRRLQPYTAHPLVRLVDDPDCIPYLVVADALITDHSSIGFEYCVLDRPLFQFNHPALVYSPPELLKLAERAAYRFSSISELPDLLERGLHVPAERSAGRRALAEACFYKPGTATARAVDLLLRLARGENPRLALAPPEQASRNCTRFTSHRDSCATRSGAVEPCSRRASADGGPRRA
jgi:hypothetical protein